MRFAIPSFLAALLLAASSAPVHAGSSSFAQLEGSPQLRSASALVLDAQGNVIYDKDADAVRPIASITKLMTAMVILDAKLDLEKRITIDKRGALAGVSSSNISSSGSRMDWLMLLFS